MPARRSTRPIATCAPRSLVGLGEYDAALAIYAALLAEQDAQPKGWMSYGHALKTVGRGDEAVAAYRRAIALQPRLGEAWWSLANLKTFRFDAGERARRWRRCSTARP